jgi:hypothetical protein
MRSSRQVRTFDQRLEGLLQRRGPVIDMHVVQVDVVGPQPAQAVVDRLAQRVAAGALELDRAPVDLPAAHLVLVVHPAAALGGQEHLVPMPAAVQPAAQQRLALPAGETGRGPPGVAVGGVEEVAAGVEISVQHPHRRRLIGRRTHEHAAERQLADLLAGAPKFDGLHVRGSFSSESDATHAMSWSGLEVKRGGGPRAAGTDPAQPAHRTPERVRRPDEDAVIAAVRVAVSRTAKTEDFLHVRQWLGEAVAATEICHALLIAADLDAEGGADITGISRAPTARRARRECGCSNSPGSCAATRSGSGRCNTSGTTWATPFGCWRTSTRPTTTPPAASDLT